MRDGRLRRLQKRRLQKMVDMCFWFKKSHAFDVVYMKKYDRTLTKESKKIGNDQELIQSNLTTHPQNQKGNKHIHTFINVHESQS